jgi:hypothetical protein
VTNGQTPDGQAGAKRGVVSVFDRLEVDDYRYYHSTRADLRARDLQVGLGPSRVWSPT